MVHHTPQETLIVGTNLGEFFQGLVTAAVANQRVEAAEATVHYVVNLLSSFTLSRHLYEQTPDGPMIRPLAIIYCEAVDAATVEERNRALKRLGDVALFIAGVFPNSLARKLVDVDYYISMGGNAYGHLSDIVRDTLRWRAFGDIFDELSVKFIKFVDVLAEVSEKAHFTNNADILRLYEIWMRTGSKHAERQLRKLGIEPSTGSVSRRHH